MEKESHYSHSEDFIKNFGKRLRQLRKDRGHTIAEAVELLGISRSTYTAWELGTRFPMSKSVSDLAELYKTTVDYLMLKTDDPNSEHKNKDLKFILDNAVDYTWKGKSISKSKLEAIAALMDASFEE